MNRDVPDPTTRRPYDPALYARLYRGVEPQLRAVARAVEVGRLTREQGRGRAHAILAALVEAYRTACAS